MQWQLGCQTRESGNVSRATMGSNKARGRGLRIPIPVKCRIKTKPQKRRVKRVFWGGSDAENE